MLHHALKMAWRVLGRRKVFTAISLFGISLTLLVLMVAAALADHVLGAHPPETRLHRTLGIYGLGMVGEQASSTGFPGYAFLDAHARDLPGVEATSFFRRRNRQLERTPHESRTGRSGWRRRGRRCRQRRAPARGRLPFRKPAGPGCRRIGHRSIGRAPRST